MFAIKFNEKIKVDFGQLYNLIIVATINFYFVIRIIKMWKLDKSIKINKKEEICMSFGFI